MGGFVVQRDDPQADDVRRVLAAHLSFAHEHSPPDDVHALDVDALMGEGVELYSVREAGVLVGVGALRQLDAQHAELKSMHTAVAARGRGVGRVMLEHLLAVARERGCRRVSLETGTPDAFAPARALYASAGFTPCEPFADYADSPYSVCMTLGLADPEASVAEQAGRGPEQHRAGVTGVRALREP